MNVNSSLASYSLDVKEIEKIYFGVKSAIEIRNESVCKIFNTKLSGPNSVYDERMGVLEEGKKCQTCLGNENVCPGHSACIELNEFILHPLFLKDICNYLKCFCVTCYKLLITKDQIFLNSLNVLKGMRRFEAILEKMDKIDQCPNGGHPKPHIKIDPNDSSIIMTYKEQDKSKISIELTTDEILKLFDSIKDDDIKLLGFDPENVHPRNFVITTFPVLPPCCRPWVVSDGNICDDDLTNQILEIIKSNNHLEKKDGITIPEDTKKKYIQSLKFRISTFYNNSKGKAKISSSSRAIRGVKERIAGKDGLIRCHIQGKRVDFSARTVIGGSPSASFNTVEVPRKIANILTTPIKVTYFNIDYLTKKVNTEEANYLYTLEGKKINLKYALWQRQTKLQEGDIVYRLVRKDSFLTEKEYLIKDTLFELRKGDKILRKNLDDKDNVISEELINPVKTRLRKFIKLHIGEIVELKMQEGQFVSLGRQPTLHRQSMQGLKVKLVDWDVFKFNLALTKAYNADFDGDEMNLHLPQSEESHVELQVLANAENNMISVQSSKPIICIVQDSLLAAYMMTRGIQKITKEQFFNIAVNLVDFDVDKLFKKMQSIRRVFKDKGKKCQCFNGKGLFSLILPDDLNYTMKTNSVEENILKIHAGVLYEGTLDKNVLGSVHNSLIQILYKEYKDKSITSKFIDNVHAITHGWNLLKGFSTGIKDCLLTDKTKEKEISNSIEKATVEIEGINKITKHPGIKEARIIGALGRTKDRGLKIAKDSLAKDNNCMAMVMSGSKGDFFNICSITSSMAQQHLQGGRIPKNLNHGKRSLLHYKFEDLDMATEIESRGFVKNSMINGLNPREYIMHAMVGREGVISSSCMTSNSGYNSRRICKLQESLQTKHDGTIRDSTDRLYQYAYGENGIEPSYTVKVNNKQQVCDISRIIDKINLNKNKT